MGATPSKPTLPPPAPVLPPLPRSIGDLNEAYVKQVRDWAGFHGRRFQQQAQVNTGQLTRMRCDRSVQEMIPHCSPAPPLLPFSVQYA